MMGKFISFFAAKTVTFFESAKTIYYIVVGALSVFGGLIINVLGGWDVGLRLMCVCIAVDIITGIICALFFKKSRKTEDGAFKSEISLKGLFRKAVIFLVLILAVQVDTYFNTNLLRSGTIIFFAANEGMSIIENLGIMGVPFPPAMKEAFEMLRKKSEPSE